MTSLETLRVAIYAILRNKLRSFLTTLGVIIGSNRERPRQGELVGGSGRSQP